MATWEDIQKANETINTTDIKGKAYAEVNQRIKAFRMVYPDGGIRTQMISNENGVCIFEARVFITESDGSVRLLGTGHAYEKEDSSFINKTSYIENCETSAVGRALGMCGFGIDAVASVEEVQNAQMNQNKKATPVQIETLSKVYTGDNLKRLLDANKISKIEDLPRDVASTIIQKLRRV